MPTILLAVRPSKSFSPKPDYVKDTPDGIIYGVNVNYDPTLLSTRARRLADNLNTTIYRGDDLDSETAVAMYSPSVEEAANWVTPGYDPPSTLSERVRAAERLRAMYGPYLCDSRIVMAQRPAPLYDQLVHRSIEGYLESFARVSGLYVRRTLRDQWVKVDPEGPDHAEPRGAHSIRKWVTMFRVVGVRL